jgi:hypothetical protein
MSRPPAKKPTPEPAAKQHSWAIYRLKGTPGNVEAPDKETAIQRAIEEFSVAPELRKQLLACRRAWQRRMMARAPQTVSRNRREVVCAMLATAPDQMEVECPITLLRSATCRAPKSFLPRR